MFSALFKRDLSGFFYSNSAYFVFAAYALISMLMCIFKGEYFFIGDDSLRSFFVFQPQIMALIIPIITMRGWAEEYRSSTVEVLMSFPVSTLKMVLSKFFSAWCAALIMSLAVIPLIITQALYIDSDWGSIFCSFIGFVLGCAVLCAAGTLASALTAVPAVAYVAGLTFSFVIINFNANAIIPRLSDNLPFFFERVFDFSAWYQNFLNGQVNPAGVFYFVALTALLLFFNWLIIFNRRERQ
ncbi:MAG: ABC transporter permease subunit [Alphaproteobacteria bacterium]|nr:ABC transporter permease subunit [Alphaproteobacteria bacterium]